MVEQTHPEPTASTVESECIFLEDFSSGVLDRSRWNVRTTGTVVNDEQQGYVDSPETIYVTAGAEAEAEGAGGNALAIHPRFRPGHVTTAGDQFDFVSGRIDTRGKFQFRYGTASARLKLPEGRGLWPAFWLMGDGTWPDTGEIDVMEFVGEPDWVSCAVHGPGYSGEQALVNNRYFAAGPVAADWHVYAVDWGPDRLTFTVDGEVVYRVTRPMVDFFGPWTFDNDKFLILNLALGGVYPFKSNGIRSPYHGLSHEAVDSIKADRARVLIDWIRVDRSGAKQA